MSDLSIKEKLEIIIDALEIKINEEFTKDERKILLAELTNSYLIAASINNVKDKNNSKLMFNYTEDILEQTSKESNISEIINCIIYSGLTVRN